MAFVGSVFALNLVVVAILGAVALVATDLNLNLAASIGFALSGIAVCFVLFVALPFAVAALVEILAGVADRFVVAFEMPVIAADLIVVVLVFAFVAVLPFASIVALAMAALVLILFVAVVVVVIGLFFAVGNSALFAVVVVVVVVVVVSVPLERVHRQSRYLSCVRCQVEPSDPLH